MKTNTVITRIILLIIILVPMLIIPNAVTQDTDLPKVICLFFFGTILLIFMLISYKKLNIDKKDILILVFLLLMYVSTVFSSDLMVSIIGEPQRYEGFLMFIVYVCIYMCAKKFLVLENKLNFFMNILFFHALAINLLGILQRYINYPLLKPIFNKGICATFGHHNFFGSYISIILPIVLFIYILKGNKKLLILTILTFFNMIACATRSSWVAFTVFFFIGILFLIMQKNKKYYKRFFIVLLLFILIFIYLYNGFTIMKFFEKEKGTYNNKKENVTQKKVEKIITEIKTTKTEGINQKMGTSRIWIWSATLKVIKQKPLIGCGTDNLKQGLILYAKKDFEDFYNDRQEVIDKAHNEYLQIAATTGIPSLIIYCMFITAILFPKIKQISKNKTIFIISLSIISYLVQAFFNISTIGVAPLFWVLLGIIDNEDLVKKLNEEITKN